MLVLLLLLLPRAESHATSGCKLKVRAWGSSGGAITLARMPAPSTAAATTVETLSVAMAAASSSPAR